MRELYERIRKLDYGRDNELITVTGGPLCGQKALLTDKKIVWESSPIKLDALEGLPSGQVFRERLVHVKTLVVCGAGFIGQAVIGLGRFLGWRVVSIDDRLDFTHMAEAAGSCEAICDSFPHALSSIDIPYDEDTYFVVATRGHRYDKECLDEILKHPFGYLGMLGSSGRSALMRAALRNEGFSSQLVDKIHAPIGLKIGAQTPEEIGISILSEIIQFKESRSQGDVFPDDLINAILDLYDSGPSSDRPESLESEIGSTRISLETMPEASEEMPILNQAGAETASERIQARKERVHERGQSCNNNEEKRTCRAVLATIVSRRGSTPRREGTRMLIRRDSSTVGTIGGGCMEAEVIREARGILACGNEFIPEVFTVDLTGSSGREADMLCGGIMDVFMEPL